MSKVGETKKKLGFTEYEQSLENDIHEAELNLSHHLAYNLGKIMGALSLIYENPRMCSELASKGFTLEEQETLNSLLHKLATTFYVDNRERQKGEGN